MAPGSELSALDRKRLTALRLDGCHDVSCLVWPRDKSQGNLKAAFCQPRGDPRANAA